MLYFMANLFRTLHTKFFPNSPSFLEDRTKTFWLTFFLNMVYIHNQLTCTNSYYIPISFAPSSFMSFRFGRLMQRYLTKYRYNTFLFTHYIKINVPSLCDFRCCVSWRGHVSQVPSLCDFNRCVLSW